MKQFSFRLEPVLAYRKLVEDGEEYKLRAINSAILDAQKGCEELNRQIESCCDRLKEECRGTIDMDGIRTLSRYLEKLRGEMVRGQQAVLKLHHDRSRQMASLLEARRGREVVEKLKEDRLSHHEKEARALEQRMLDELSVTQFGRLKEQNLPSETSPSRKD